METINERFAHLLKEKKISIKEMAHRMGKSEVYVRKLTQAGQSFGIEPVRATIDALPDVSPDWLLYGRGDVLRPRLTTNTEGRGVPYYEDIEATCSLLSTYEDSPERTTFFIDYEHFNDCTAYLPVVGDSMVPQYCAGEIIAVKRVWNLDIIQWGEAYLVVTDSEANSLRTVKLVHPGPTPTELTLRASNPDYAGDMVIPKAHIVALFLIKGKIKRNQL